MGFHITCVFIPPSHCSLSNMAEPQIPTKQKAAIYDNPGTVSTKIVEIDVPEPGPGEVLVNLYV